MVTFEKKRQKMLDKLQQFKEDFDEFTREVSPKDWRVTGHYFLELNKLERNILSFREMNKEEKELYIKS